MLLSWQIVVVVCSFFQAILYLVQEFFIFFYRLNKILLIKNQIQLLRVNPDSQNKHYKGSKERDSKVKQTLQPRLIKIMRCGILSSYVYSLMWSAALQVSLCVLHWEPCLSRGFQFLHHRIESCSVQVD